MTQDPSLFTGWNRIAWLLGQRWPEWEPSVHERADWKRMIGGCKVEWMDEAMLRVKQQFSSKIPQVKWLLGKYNQVKEENFEIARAGQERPVKEVEADFMIEVTRDRQECMDYLDAIDPDTLDAARKSVREYRGRLLTGWGTEDVRSWSWAVRFAVMFHMQDAPTEHLIDGCSD